MRAPPVLTTLRLLPVAIPEEEPRPRAATRCLKDEPVRLIERAPPPRTLLAQASCNTRNACTTLVAAMTTSLNNQKLFKPTTKLLT
ncbi:hypothetical protein NDU88_001966 [Pleurodeles waltl]|uniref:Uncharacterized protein n=1 Tax=Pleurodeles waltl TaxID=8319 RepID=A0AAV7WNA1_PLEWA|nr:hypothetical protein NDU88_001966 [Pleurodeles waltl]